MAYLKLSKACISSEPFTHIQGYLIFCIGATCFCLGVLVFKLQQKLVARQVKVNAWQQIS